MALAQLRPRRRFCLLLAVMLAIMVIVKLIVLDPKMALDLSSSPSWLDYLKDHSFEGACNCSAILQGEREALEQSKGLLINDHSLEGDCNCPAILQGEREALEQAKRLLINDHSLEGACNCSAILQGEREALEQAKGLLIEPHFRERTQLSDEHYVNVTKDCQAFRSDRSYLPFPLSLEEEQFPLAFSLVVHHKVQNFERLLRSIYTPQNFYCVHVDGKASASVRSAITGITSCFPNVFLVSQPVEVIYGSWSRVQADINCMSDLYSANTSWKYLINLCGQDFPIKTNLEMVRSLTALKGGNSMESEAMPSNKVWRWQKVHETVDGAIRGTEKDKSPPPFNLPIMSGGGYIVASRAFVGHVLEDGKVRALIEWSHDTWAAEEFLWATIQRMPGVPGSHKLSPKFHTSDLQAISRLVKWEWHEGAEDNPDALYPPCQGHHVRSVCVYGAGDLQWMLQQHHLFANKFDLDTDAVAVHCLEKHLRHKALAESRVIGSSTFTGILSQQGRALDIYTQF